ncbi:MAG TPA: Arc family DNA-binding protein [Ktedonobacteraceae bacterium]|nr:Arc family DNA-binding protein [Ktedonobacteraceae bacterium]
MEKEIIAITTRYPKEVVEALKQLAQDHHRSLNSEVIQALQEYIQRHQKAGKRDAQSL